MKYLILKRADLNGKLCFPGDVIADPYNENLLISRGFIAPANSNAKVTVDIWENVPKEPVPAESPLPEATVSSEEPAPATEEQAPSAAPSAKEPAHKQASEEPEAK